MLSATQGAVNTHGQGEQQPDLALAELGQELDRISFYQLEAKYPTLAEGIEDAIAQGAGVAEVRRFALRRGMPPEWVAWLENAARAVVLE